MSKTGSNPVQIEKGYRPRKKKGIILMDYSDAECEKVKKPKKSRKLAHEKWSGSLICKLIDEYEVRPCLWDIFYRVSADLSAAILVYNFTR